MFVLKNLFSISTSKHSELEDIENVCGGYNGKYSTHYIDYCLPQLHKS